MKCPDCQFDNREGIKFCEECGAKFDLECPACKAKIPLGRKFCGECGVTLIPTKENSDKESETESLSSHPSTIDSPSEAPVIVGERKHVTVLFSDLTGYTAISEKLDPEEVKDITSQVFGEVAKIVAKYDGFIEKFIGDAAMAIFGIPNAHEDDPIRAIRAAREIHQCVEIMSPEIEKKTGHPISMHTGINTGLVVTGEVDLERGTHGVAGDTINLASRLSAVANPGDILVDVDTCHLVEGMFACEYLEAASVKGKVEPVQVYRVLGQREKPVTIRRLSGLRSSLVGRNVEMAELSEAIKNLMNGKGSIFSICGEAGTGKSRLVEEFKAELNHEEIQWIEGHAYEYSQNIPYYPLIDLINRLLNIDDKDPPESVREKLESGLKPLIGNQTDLIPFVGALYSLQYPDSDKVSPEFWKSKLQAAILSLLSNLSERLPTVFFLEDLHWSDPSFVELLKRACIEIRQPAIVLCAYRPTFSLFTGHQVQSLGKIYHEIQLKNLSLSVSQRMLESLLDTDAIPSKLKHWVQKRAEGNPFYLEELVNTLIESGSLIKEKSGWHLTRTISESDIPASLHGLISGRLDRLETHTKRILQEASVIGRDFLYDILKRVSDLEDSIDVELRHLERLDLIRARSLQPDIEYMFKHALTREIVYNGLLKKQRQEIHEHIAMVMETVFQDRLAEFNETLAYHFSRGHSVGKAVDYLIKSGEKSLARYAVEEAHKYFKKAYDILISKERLSKSDEIILFKILNSWGYAYYYLGEINEFVNLYSNHKIQADLLEDKTETGMFYAWLGIAIYMAGRSKESYDCLQRSLKIGEETGNQKAIGYACAWLTFACSELGLLDEGVVYGERAQKIAESYSSDQYLFFKSLAGLCLIYCFKGNTSKVFEGTDRLLEYGEETANSRSKVFGHWIKGYGYFFSGDVKSSLLSSEKAIDVALDPTYAQCPKSALGMAYFLGGQFQEAENILKSCLNFCEKRGIGEFSVTAQFLLAPALIAKGDMQKGLHLIETAQKSLLNNQRKTQYALSEFILGEINSQIATGPKPSLSIVAKNIGFLIKNIPFARKKAEQHLLKAIDTLLEIGGKGFLGQVYLSLGLLYQASKEMDKAKLYILRSIDVFKECEANSNIKQANEALDKLV